ncbi:hypothetical protein ACWY4P_45490 [Streptomyces sp. LZ34]
MNDVSSPAAAPGDAGEALSGLVTVPLPETSSVRSRRMLVFVEDAAEAIVSAYVEAG